MTKKDRKVIAFAMFVAAGLILIGLFVLWFYVIWNGDDPRLAETAFASFIIALVLAFGGAGVLIV